MSAYMTQLLGCCEQCGATISDADALAIFDAADEDGNAKLSFQVITT
jgi:hypothetical protein